MHSRVEVVSHGRSGVVHYREGANAHAFEWELGGGDVILSIYVPGPAEWDARLPWAAGRRAEVLQHLAQVVRRQQFPAGRAEIGERWITIREARAPWQLLGEWLARLRRG
jgi:hypothetical protein